MRVFPLEEIKSKLNLVKAILQQEEGFQMYSKGGVIVPPVGYMNMGEKCGEVHIKCGWMSGDDIFAVKIAGAYPQNESRVEGAILVFNARTGKPIAVLQDEGYLTNIRTAIAGLIAAKYLAPKEIRAIGVIGTGVQARLQAELLKHTTSCRDLFVWGRNDEKIQDYITDMTQADFRVQQAASPSEICRRCNLIITTTSAKEPLIYAKDIQKGTHITAVGADAPGKQELDPAIFQLADICVVDSRSQCLDHGEVSHPYQAGIIQEKNLVELGEVISDPSLRRKHQNQITIADLTGVGVQDIQIAKSILHEI